MNTEVVNGVESIECGVPNSDGSLPSVWVKFNNIADGSVSYTSNKDTETPIIPEDKDVALLTLFTPAAADTFNFDLLEISEANLALLFNVVQDATTSTTTILASRLRPNLVIRLTTRPQLGLKKQYVFGNTTCTMAYKNNFTKNALVAISVTAAIYSYVDTNGDTALYTIQTLAADGTPIDQTLPIVNAGADQPTVSASTATLTGTATPDGIKTIASTTWTKKSGPGGVGITTPGSLSTGLTGLVTGVYTFTLTAIDSNGNVASDDVVVTHT